MDARPKLLFAKNSLPDFYFELKQKINPLISCNAKKAMLTTTIKVVVFPSLYALSFTWLITKGNQLEVLYISYALLGLLMPLTVLNIVHDSIHNCLYKNKKANLILMHLLDLMGGDSFVWQKRHVLFHHPYANITGWDIDLEKRKLFKLSPADDSKKMHRYQHIYMPFFYPLFTLQWIFFRDFKDYFDIGSMFRKKTKVPLIAFIKLLIFKGVYLAYILIAPAMVLQISWHHIAAGFLLMHAIAGVLTLLIVLPNHWDEDATFIVAHDRLCVEETWAYHQLKNTNDFAIDSQFSNFIMGGLNHHVAHHLFPHINHNYLPFITKELIKIAKEKKLPYKCFSFTGAIRSHFMLLKKNGYSGDIFNQQ